MDGADGSLISLLIPGLEHKASLQTRAEDSSSHPSCHAGQLDKGLREAGECQSLPSLVLSVTALLAHVCVAVPQLGQKSDVFVTQSNFKQD